MKKFIFFLLSVSVITLSCKKAMQNDCLPSEVVSLDGAATLKAGNFNFALLENKGVAKIYLQKDRRYVLGLEQMEITTTTDFAVYLSPTSTLSNASLKLFSARSIVGNQYYMLPANFSIEGFDFVLMQNDRADLALANAQLK